METGKKGQKKEKERGNGRGNRDKHFKLCSNFAKVGTKHPGWIPERARGREYTQVTYILSVFEEEAEAEIEAINK